MNEVIFRYLNTHLGHYASLEMQLLSPTPVAIGARLLGQTRNTSFELDDGFFFRTIREFVIDLERLRTGDALLAELFSADERTQMEVTLPSPTARSITVRVLHDVSLPGDPVSSHVDVEPGMRFTWGSLELDRSYIETLVRDMGRCIREGEA